MKLSLRRKHKKRLITRVKQPLETPQILNECWSMYFMSDLLADGRKVRVFNVLDAFYFNDIYQLQRLADKWREDYNFNPPYKALGNKSPKEYKPRFDE